MTTAILILRHGQSTWNAEGRWQGQADPPLSTLGVKQARTAATALGSFDLVASSTLQRASTTAEIIAKEIGIGPVQLDEDLQERRAGAYEGLTKEQIEDQWPGRLVEGPLPDGWEGDDVLITRTIAALGRIAGTIGDGSALVVSHGGVLRTLDRTLGEPDRPIHNLCGRWYELGPGVFRGGEFVETIPPELRPSQPGPAQSANTEQWRV